MTGVGYKGPRKDKFLNMAEETIPAEFKGEAGARVEQRFMAEAEDLLERVLRRRRWAVSDRDAVAAFLLRLVERERKAAAKRAGGL
jgi:hypothetical protein